MSLHALPAHELAAKIRRRECSAVEAARSYLDRIDRLDPKVRAYLTVTREAALARAAAIDADLAAGRDPGPLAGVPLALKDNLSTRGVRTTCASKILEKFIPPYDAHVVERLHAAGAVFLGKTNLDEFAMGSSTENSAYHPTHNPWNLAKVPGGSSGGSAASIAGGLAAAALGSDTGGSIRQPAALCGVVGLKPTYGRISRYGLVAFASSLDQIGPITRDVRDAALLLQVTAGKDSRDSTSADLPVPDYLADLDKGVAGMRLGLPKEYFGAGLDPEIRKSVEAAAATYRKLGAETVEVSLPHTDYGIATYYVIAPSEASSNLARYDGVHYGHRTAEKTGLAAMYSKSRDEGFGPEVKRRIILGTFALSSGYYDAYYVKALKVRRLVKRDFDQAFGKVDAILCPTSPVPAFGIGEKSGDPLALYLMDVLTVCCNLAGIPGISLPCGFTGQGLPIGLQLLGKPFDEARLLRIARAFESATEFHRQRPADPE